MLVVDLFAQNGASLSPGIISGTGGLSDIERPELVCGPAAAEVRLHSGVQV